MNQYVIVESDNRKDLDTIERTIKGSKIPCNLSYDIDNVYYKDKLEETISLSKYKDILEEHKKDLLDEFILYKFNSAQNEIVEQIINDFLAEKGLLDEQYI